MIPIRTKPIAMLPSVGTITENLNQIKFAIGGDLTSEVKVAHDGGAVELARAFVALRSLKDEIDECSKIFSKLFEDVKGVQLPAKFEAEGVPTINLDEGYRVSVSHRVFASIKTGQKDMAMKWLRSNGLEDLVTETVNSSTLSAVAKSMAEENRELDGELFSVAVLPSTSVTKTK